MKALTYFHSRITIVRMLVVGSAICLWNAGSALAAPTPDGPSVSQFFGDDTNTSTLYRYGTTSLPQPYTQSCPWVVNGLNDAGFTNANGWNFTWADSSTDAEMMPDLSVVKYQPWVVNQPTYTDPNGGDWGGAITNDEAGGADFELKFDPTGSIEDPLNGQNFHWIQALIANYRGNTGTSTSTGRLDGYSAGMPFYDQNSAAGTHDGVGYFADIPGINEAEYEGNPVADVQFQVFLALDNGAGGDFAHNVTIYGGYWWGYQYTAVDVPEPAMGLAGLLLLGCCAQSRKRKGHQA